MKTWWTWLSFRVVDRGLSYRGTKGSVKSLIVPPCTAWIRENVEKDLTVKKKNGLSKPLSRGKTISLPFFPCYSIGYNGTRAPSNKSI